MTHLMVQIDLPARRVVQRDRNGDVSPLPFPGKSETSDLHGIDLRSAPSRTGRKPGQMSHSQRGLVLLLGLPANGQE